MKITDIVWDTDGEKIDYLPTEVEIDESVDEEDIANCLTDNYGFCVTSYSVADTDE